MAVLEVLQSNLIGTVPGWVSNVKGTGSSVGDPSAGSRSTSNARLSPSAATTADRIGAGILTAIVLIGVVSGSVVMVMD